MLKLKSLLNQKRKKLLSLKEAVDKLNKKSLKVSNTYTLKWREENGDRFEIKFCAAVGEKYELYPPTSSKDSLIVRMGCLHCSHCSEFIFECKNPIYLSVFRTIRHYNRSGCLHREDGPAIIHWYGKFEWYINGKRLSAEKEKVLNIWYKNKNES